MMRTSCKVISRTPETPTYFALSVKFEAFYFSAVRYIYKLSK